MVALIAFALIASAGCRTLSPNTSHAPPPTLPHLPEVFMPQIHASPIDLPQTDFHRVEEPDRYSAFRPIMPGELDVSPPPVWTSPVQESPVQETPVLEIRSEPTIVEVPMIEPQPCIITLSAINELNQRIAELELQLEEARQNPQPVLAIWDEPLTKPMVETETTVAIPLPIINRHGVHVYADDSQNVRIEIMDGALFVPNVWVLSAEGEETLRVIAAEIMAFDPRAVIGIEGHTDNLMSDPSNPTQKHEISTVKTRAVMDFFVNALHWDAGLISVSSFGRSRPVADNGTPEGRARNNRIEIVVREGV